MPCCEVGPIPAPDPGGLPRCHRRLPEGRELDPSTAALAAIAAIHWESFTRYGGQTVGLGLRNEDSLYVPSSFSPRPCGRRRRWPIRWPAQCSFRPSGTTRRSRRPDFRSLSDPNDANGYIALAGALSFSGQPTEALKAVDVAMRLIRTIRRPTCTRVVWRNSPQGGIARPWPRWECPRQECRRLLVAALLLSAYGLAGRGADARRLSTSDPTRRATRPSRFHDPLTVRAVTYWYPSAVPKMQSALLTVCQWRGCRTSRRKQSSAQNLGSRRLHFEHLDRGSPSAALNSAGVRLMTGSVP